MGAYLQRFLDFSRLPLNRGKEDFLISALSDPRNNDDFRQAATQNPSLIFDAIAAIPQSGIARKMYGDALGNLPALLNKNPDDRTSILTSMTNAMNLLYKAGGMNRYEIADRLDAGSLYDMIGKNPDDIYRATHKYSQDKMGSRLKRDGKTLSDLAQSTPERQSLFPRVVDASIRYNGFSPLWDMADPQARIKIVDVLLNNMHEPRFATTIPKVLEFSRGNKDLQKHIEDEIVKGASRTNATPREKANSYALASWYAHHMDTVNGANANMLSDIKQNTAPFWNRMQGLDTEALYAGQKTAYQVHVFYDDDDGHSSHRSFMSDAKKAGYKATENHGFTVLRKTNPDTGKAIEMVVTDPLYDGSKDLAREVNRYLQEKGGKPSYVVNRGHIYNSSSISNFIDKETRLVFMGSCDGNTTVDTLYAKSKSLQIISTEGVGKTEINNPSLLWLNTQILSGSQIAWQDLRNQWDTMGDKNKRLKKDLSDYKTPPENTPAALMELGTYLSAPQPRTQRVYGELQGLTDHFNGNKPDGANPAIAASPIKPALTMAPAAPEPA